MQWTAPTKRSDKPFSYTEAVKHMGQLREIIYVGHYTCNMVPNQSFMSVSVHILCLR